MAVTNTSKFNEIKNKIFLDALAKSDARWDGKQEYYFMWPNSKCVVFAFGILKFLLFARCVLPSFSLFIGVIESFDLVL